MADLTLTTHPADQEKKDEPNVDVHDFAKPLEPLGPPTQLPTSKPTASVTTQCADSKVNPPDSTPILSSEVPESESTSRSAWTRKTPSHSKPVPRLDYEEPPWSGTAPPGYSLEVIKNGSIVSRHDLGGLGVFTMGRWTECHLTLDHPSLSRYHAVLQYRSKADPPRYEAGFYLQDLDSTHGTYHNKKRCYPRKYYRLCVGHTVKLGGSSRLLILQGPPEDQEAESEQSAKELMEQANRKKAQAQILAQSEAERDTRAEEAEQELGVSWGMGEDAEEEPDMDNNPFALPDKTDESLYLDDPKRTLRGWFEREGHELEYDCVEQGYATFKCTVTLPLETGSIVAESVVKGKKKEAVVQCALEACRILDRLGQLRQSHHESRAKKVIKKWEDDDFYASDEDEFLDRTGTIAKKRQVRMQIAGKSETLAVETFETLTVKHKRVVEDKAKAQEELRIAIDNSKRSESEPDDLDQFMANLKSGGNQDKSTISKLKQKVTELQKEASRLEKLIEITRPTALPSLQSAETSVSQPPQNSTVKPSSKFAGVLVGKRGASNKLRTIATNTSSVKPSTPSPSSVPLDPTSDGKDKTSCVVQEIQTSVENSSLEPPKSPETSLDEKTKPASSLPSSVPIPQESQTNELTSPNSQKEGAQNRKTVSSSKKTVGLSSLKRTIEKCRMDEEKVEGDYDCSDPKYATWMPPEGQSGDGRTSLNDKYGY